MTTLATPAAEALALTSSEYAGRPNGQSAVVDVVKNWHNDTDLSGHTGAYVTCDEQPCYGVRRIATPQGWSGQ